MTPRDLNVGVDATGTKIEFLEPRLASVGQRELQQYALRHSIESETERV